MQRRELILAPLCEAALLLIVGLAGWAVHTPLLFASLGPTAFELAEMPHRKGARPYNVIVGHLLAVAAGFLAIFLTHAWAVPAFSGNDAPLRRVWAAVLASLLTVLFTLLAKARQPAALATSLLISLGNMQAPKDAAIIMAAVLLMTIVGEPLRRWRARTMPKLEDC